MSAASAHRLGKERKGIRQSVSSCVHPLSHLYTLYSSPHVHSECWITHTLTCTLTHVRTVPRPAASQDTAPRHPNLPAPGSAASPHPPALHVGAPRRQAAALPTEPPLHGPPRWEGRRGPGVGRTKRASNRAPHCLPEGRERRLGRAQ